MCAIKSHPSSVKETWLSCPREWTWSVLNWFPKVVFDHVHKCSDRNVLSKRVPGLSPLPGLWFPSTSFCSSQNQAAGTFSTVDGFVIYQRITEVGRHLWRSCSPAPPSRAGCPGLCPDDFWMSWRTETPQPLWATCSCMQPPSQWGKKNNNCN